jgi:hypothetical protein
LKLEEICRKTDMDAMARDVEPFLFDAVDKKKVLWFEEYWRQVSGI